MGLGRMLPLASCVILILVGSCGPALSQPSDTPAALREAVLRASTRDKAGVAYKDYFLRLGLGGLRDRVKDEDTGIALQAAWEVHKKPIKRPTQIIGRVDDVYDPGELAKFLEVLNDRTKAPVPDWWAKNILDVDLFPGRHHAFIGSAKRAAPKLREAKEGVGVAETAKLEEKADILVYTVGSRVVRFPKATFDEVLLASYTGLMGDKRAIIAAFSPLSGFPFKLAGFTGEGGKPAWKVDVWAAGRTSLAGEGHHWVELKEKGDTVFVFGAESHGMYLEGFEAATGKCRFRFCTCYWFNFSEAWGLK